jgi:hypothetical protein
MVVDSNWWQKQTFSQFYVDSTEIKIILCKEVISIIINYLLESSKTEWKPKQKQINNEIS